MKAVTKVLNRRLWDAAVKVQKFLASNQIDNCVIGGLAVNRWGDPRTTSDVDLTLIVPFGDEKATATTVLQAFASRIEAPFEFAIRARILLVVDPDGVKLDLSLGGLPFELRMLNRSSWWKVDGLEPVRTCSAEDLVITKAFASRPQDWIDVERIVIRQKERLDRSLILSELEPLVSLKEEPEILERLKRLFRANSL